MFGQHHPFGRHGRNARDHDSDHLIFDGPADRAAWEDGEEHRGRRGRGMRDGGPGRRFGHGGRFFENGMLRHIILALIAEEPRHGYDLIKDLEERTGGAYKASAGVVYPSLTLLEETGQIEVISTEGNKKLYAITDDGRNTVAKHKEDVEAILARFSEMRANRPIESDPRLVRAVENLRLALRLKFNDGELDDQRLSALSTLLDETARRIEEI